MRLTVSLLCVIFFAMATPITAKAQPTLEITKSEVEALLKKSKLTGGDAIRLGQAFENGKGVRRDRVTAMFYYKGDDPSFVRIPRTPAGLAQLKRLVTDIQLRAEKNEPEALYELAAAYNGYYINIPNGNARALLLHIRAAEAGNIYAARRLEYIYSTGNYDGPVNPELALYWTQKLASWGDPTGYLNLGEAYAYGKQVPRDDTKAMSLWLKAANLDLSTGDTVDTSTIISARIRVASFYRDGRGVPKNPSQALYWFRQTGKEGRSHVEKLLFEHPELAEKEIETIDTPKPAPLAAALASLPSNNGPRFALVIGNAAYSGQLGSLANPANDARIIATSLRNAGFTVDMVIDGDARAMKEAINSLSQKVSAAGNNATGLFYYAGHGVQADGVNYLVPVRATLESEADLSLEAVRADAALSQLRRAGARTVIMILDACRNMPLARTSRSGTSGLARMQSVGGAYIAYATAPGETASDGRGGNSPFSLALSRQLARKGQSIEVMFRNVRAEVSESTGGQQTPWDSSSLTDDFIFTP